MSLDFGKLNFYTSFKPASAFPLDARGYFENKQVADKAVASAKSAGSTDSIYYIGQEIVVVENDVATLYIIQPGDGVEHFTPYLAKIDVDLNNYYTKSEIDDKIEEGVGNVDEDAVREIVEDYVDNNAGAIVYLNTKEHIAQNIELQDVYPIQHSGSILRVVSKNRVKYPISSHTFSGLTIAMTNKTGVKITGKATSAVEYSYKKVAEVDILAPGKYTLSTDNNGVDVDGNQCWIAYSLNDSNDTAIVSYHKLGTTPVVIDTEELNCATITFSMYLNVANGTTFNTSASQTFNIQAEYGDTATPYTAPKSESEAANKKINVYGRNLLEQDVPNLPYGNELKIDGNKFIKFTSDNIGMFYYNGIMANDYDIVITETNGRIDTLKVPLLKGEPYTMSGYCRELLDAEGVALISSFSVVRGHYSHIVYEPCEMETITSNSNGICDISKLKYPYSYIALDSSDSSNDGYTIYLKYDPALSRNWTEKELEKIDKRLDYLEEFGPDVDVDVDLSNYYTKAEIDNALSSVHDDIIVSETEPVVNGETIWLQPLTINNGDGDYIVEQGTSGIWTYRKWASGIAECWGSLKTSTILNKPWDTTGFFITEAFPVDTIYFPITFTEKPSVVAAADSDYSVFLINADTKHTPTTLGNYQLARPLPLNDELNYSVSINVKGRWK